jgi:hypothetical protein
LFHIFTIYLFAKEEERRRLACAILFDMVSLAERFGNVTHGLFHFINREKTAPSSRIAASEISAEQKALMSSIKERANVIGRNVRSYGEQKYGPMWAQGEIILQDSRVAFLQQSVKTAQDSSGKDDSLLVDVGYADSTQDRIKIRYDLEHSEIVSYENRSGNDTIVYIHDQPGMRNPVNLELSKILKPVDELLCLVEARSYFLNYNVDAQDISPLPSSSF